MVKITADDSGDVKRLISVDSGATWLAYKAGTWQTFAGNIADKLAIYAFANTTAELSLITETQWAEILPAATMGKKIRFLNLLSIENIDDDTEARSVSIEQQRKGNFQKVSCELFEESMFADHLCIKYLGSETIQELRMVLDIPMH